MNIGEVLRKKFKSLIALQEAFPDEDACMEFLESIRWEGIIINPFTDGYDDYCTCKKKWTYKCKITKKYFNAKTNTIFENTKISLRIWFQVIFRMITSKQGIPATTIAREYGLSRRTAYFMLMKIRNAMQFENCQKLNGIVEVDEYYAGGILRNMHYDKKLEAKQNMNYNNKIPVHGLVERKGDAVITVIPNFEADTLNANVLKYVKLGSTLYTDENQSYKRIAHFYDYNFVVHSKCNYVKGKVHTNTIESVWALLTRILKTYIRVSKKYLQKYANETVFRYNTRKMKIDEACLWLFQHLENTKITWEGIRLELNRHRAYAGNV